VKTIGVVTGARSDYGICLPVLRRIEADPSLKLQLIVTSMHLSPEFGLTARAIENDGFKIADRVEMLLSSDTPEGIAKSMGVGMLGFAQVFARAQPDVLLVVGDRFEMHAAALAALPFKIPVAHVHGGELTEGAIDNALRYSMTKLSHLHFVATQEYANRVIQIGEEPWRVTVSGAPSLDNLKNTVLLPREELTQRFGLHLGEDPLLLVTFHPVTLEYERTEWQTAELLAALKALDLPVVFTMPNADTSGRTIVRMIREFTRDCPRAQAVDSLGTQGYFSVMSLAAAMVGNSSSGIVEAASFALPVVNIGTRQLGRTRGRNVIDVDYRRESILQGVRQALDCKFREDLRGMQNPYGAGTASEKIVEVLRQIPLDKRLLVKRFHDLASGPQKDVV
jgi:UDP-N-acetylglucosamine 2-epimerase (non-hydrolysing)/GDP/UDP-N,N'-diacetylbacillosamine 2-epimerase (hydrolysing)